MVDVPTLKADCFTDTLLFNYSIILTLSIIDNTTVFFRRHFNYKHKRCKTKCKQHGKMWIRTHEENHTIGKKTSY